MRCTDENQEDHRTSCVGAERRRHPGRRRRRVVHARVAAALEGEHARHADRDPRRPARRRTAPHGGTEPASDSRHARDREAGAARYAADVQRPAPALGRRSALADRARQHHAVCPNRCRRCGSPADDAGGQGPVLRDPAVCPPPSAERRREEREGGRQGTALHDRQHLVHRSGAGPAGPVQRTARSWRRSR